MNSLGVARLGCTAADRSVPVGGARGRRGDDGDRRDGALARPVPCYFRPSRSRPALPVPPTRGRNWARQRGVGGIVHAVEERGAAKRKKASGEHLTLSNSYQMG